MMKARDLHVTTPAGRFLSLIEASLAESRAELDGLMDSSTAHAAMDVVAENLARALVAEVPGFDSSGFIRRCGGRA